MSASASVHRWELNPGHLIPAWDLVTEKHRSDYNVSPAKAQDAVHKAKGFLFPPQKMLIMLPSLIAKHIDPLEQREPYGYS